MPVLLLGVRLMHSGDQVQVVVYPVECAHARVVKREGRGVKREGVCEKRGVGVLYKVQHVLKHMHTH